VTHRPSEDQLNLLRWVVTAALAVIYIVTGFDPALYLGIAVLLLPTLVRLSKRPR